MPKPRIAILGAGPAGVAAAWQLAKQGKAEAVIFEQSARVGGNAGSFEIAGLNVDYGSHRLHPACDPNILRDLSELPDMNLLERPRHGRIRLQNRWIHFPLKPQDLALRLPISFSAGVAADAFGKMFSPKNGNGHQTFTSILEKGLGTTICRDFYFPYAEKIWGMSPEKLSAVQAQRRVSAGSLSKMATKILSVIPGFKSPGAGKFYYPQKGFGQITEALAADARKLGVEIKLKNPVCQIELADRHIITYDDGEGEKKMQADYVWSTVPLTIFSKMIVPSAPSEVLEASEKISYRAMVLIYLVLEQSQWTEYDAHYFPEAHIKITRLSEPKNYGASSEPKERTVLCAELPCAVGDRVWNASNAELAALVRDSVEQCGLPISCEISEVAVKRLPFAYPIYNEGYEECFNLQDDYIGGLERILTFGRQGLFAHDNTHHALAMAYAAVDCLRQDGDFNKSRWQEYRAEFAKHVVED